MDDGYSGVDGYAVKWSTSASDLPSATKTHEENSRSSNSGALSTGDWYCHIRSKDNAGNWGVDAATIGPFRVDATLPSEPSGITSNQNGNWNRTSNVFNIIWSGAFDGQSGIARYYYVLDKTSGTIPTTADPYITHPTQSFQTSLADGIWYFHVRPADAVGNLADNTLEVMAKIDIKGPGNVTALRGYNPWSVVS